MNVANCPRCGKIYAKNPANLCPDCIREDEEMYEKVYYYLRDNPSSTVQQVAEATGVSEDRILNYLRADRLVAVDGLQMQYPCERCGAMITSGRYCDRCVQDMQTNFQAAAEDIKAQKEREARRSGYHIGDRRTKK